MSQADQLARIDERTERMSEQLDALEKYIFKGNGRPALVSRVDAIEQKIAVAVWLFTAFGSVLAVIAGVIFK